MCFILIIKLLPWLVNTWSLHAICL